MSRNSWHHWRALLIAAWLGAALFFAGVVAPAAFAVLPTSELAGRVVARSLSWLNIAGVVLGVVLAAYTAGEMRGRMRRPRSIEYISLVVFFVSNLATVGFINLRIARLRERYDIASLAAGDPIRAEFGMLHGASVIVFAAGIVAALITLLMIVRSGREG